LISSSSATQSQNKFLFGAVAGATEGRRFCLITVPFLTDGRYNSALLFSTMQVVKIVLDDIADELCLPFFPPRIYVSTTGDFSLLIVAVESHNNKECTLRRYGTLCTPYPISTAQNDIRSAR